MIRLVRHLRSKSDVERESFAIFSKLGSKKDLSEVEKIADEIMTLSLKEVHELSLALNDAEIVGKRENTFPVHFVLAANRSPFPHPKHVFSGVDADQRPGMRNP